MTPEEFEKELIILNDATDDPEKFHSEADELMFRLLRSLGYGKGIDIIESRELWYS